MRLREKEILMEKDELRQSGNRLIALPATPAEAKVKDFVPENLSVRDFVQFVGTNVLAWRTLQTYYKCAAMEIETKFRVLNEQ